MTDVIGRAVLEIGAETKEIKQVLDELRKNLSDTAKETKGIGQNLNFMVFKDFAKDAINAIQSVIGGIVELGKHGAMVSDVSAAFDRLTASTGETSEAMLTSLRAGVVGTVSDLELMQMANKALGTGLIKTSGDMQTLSEGARALAKRTGGDTKEAFETLTSAMASGRTAQLKQFGLFVDSKVAVEEYAKSINKSVGNLTDAERATALSQGALAKLREELKNNVPDAADFGELIDQAAVKLTNFRDGLAVSVSQSPVLAAGMKAMGQAFDEAFGANQQGAIKMVSDLINEAAIFLGKMAEVGVEAVRFLMNAWSGLQVGFNLVMMGLVEGLGLLGIGIAKVIDIASQVPGSGWLKPVADGAKAAAEDLVHLGAGFKLQADQALDAAARQNAALDTVKGGIHTVVVAMEAARGKQVEATTAVQAFAGANETAAARSTEADKTIAASKRKLAEDIALVGRVGIDQRVAQLEFAKQKEIEGIAQLKEITAAESAEQVAQVTEKYRLLTAAAQLGSDEIRNTTMLLHQELLLQNTTGLDQRLLQIDFARQKELEGIQNLKLRYSAEYTEIATLINAKYAEQALAAQGLGLTVQQLAAQAGFKQRAELQKTAATAIRTYNEMKASGLFTIEALRAAHEAAEKAKVEASEEGAKFQKLTYGEVADSASSILRTLGGKNKAAALAANAIDVAAGVMKCIGQYGIPWGLIPAAAVVAQGAMQAAKIKSADNSFAMGTQGLDFANFGRQSVSMLHGNEAVIPQGRGHMLASEIADAMPGGHGEGLTAQVRNLIEAVEALPRQIGRQLAQELALRT